jgi:hypothetical protein
MKLKCNENTTAEKLEIQREVNKEKSETKIWQIYETSLSILLTPDKSWLHRHVL